jgi:hypothetical protein
MTFVCFFMVEPQCCLQSVENRVFNSCIACLEHGRLEPGSAATSQPCMLRGSGETGLSVLQHGAE